jgi:hypothetical protein
MFAYYGGQNQAGQIVNQGASQVATINAATGSNMADNLGLAAMALAKGYADRQSAEAKGKAYQQFLKVAGPDLGFSPELITELSGRPAHELGALGDGMMNSVVQHGLQMRYLDARTAAKGGGGSSGGGGGAEAAGGGGIQL